MDKYDIMYVSLYFPDEVFLFESSNVEESRQLCRFGSSTTLCCKCNLSDDHWSIWFLGSRNLAHIKFSSLWTELRTLLQAIIFFEVTYFFFFNKIRKEVYRSPINIAFSILTFQRTTCFLTLLEGSHIQFFDTF